MDAIHTIHEQIGFVHDILEQTVADCNAETLSRSFPNATISNIGSIYAHSIFSEDAIVQGMFQGKSPIFHSEGWGSKLSVQMPANPEMNLEWGRGVKLELPSFREYAKAVYEATDNYIHHLSDSELERKLPTPLGEQSLGWMVANVLVTHPVMHFGEIAALKGVQGLRGLPF